MSDPVNPLAHLRAVVFDLDGTLYDQPPLRRRMLVELALAPLSGPVRALRVTRMLAAFRKEREHLRALGQSAESLEALQYARPAARIGVPEPAMRAAVAEWMFERPLRHLGPCARRGLDAGLRRLSEAGLKLGVFSDYPVDAKLGALGVRARFSTCLDATAPEVNAFKPHPAGFAAAAARLGVAPHETLYVGDRLDVDVAGAHAAGMHAALIGHEAARSASLPAREGLQLLAHLDFTELVDAILAPRA
ncbi:MAG: HAD family hydrolase [Planctomycetota bacterium]